MYMYVCIYVHTNTQSNTCVCTQTCINKRGYVRFYLYVYKSFICIHMNPHTHTHTNTHKTLYIHPTWQTCNMLHEQPRKYQALSRRAFQRTAVDDSSLSRFSSRLAVQFLLQARIRRVVVMCTRTQGECVHVVCMYGLYGIANDGSNVTCTYACTRGLYGTCAWCIVCCVRAWSEDLYATAARIMPRQCRKKT